MVLYPGRQRGELLYAEPRDSRGWKLGFLHLRGAGGKLFPWRILPAIDNSACVSTTSGGDPAGNDCGSTTTSPGGNPDLRLSKSVASGDGSPGSVLVYQLAVLERWHPRCCRRGPPRERAAADDLPRSGVVAGVDLYPGRQRGELLHAEPWNGSGRKLGDLHLRCAGGKLIPGGPAGHRQLGVRQHDERRRSRRKRLWQHQHASGGKSGPPDIQVGGKRRRQSRECAGLSARGVERRHPRRCWRRHPRNRAAADDLPRSGVVTGVDLYPDGNAGSSCTLSLGTAAAGSSATYTFAVQVASSFPADPPAIDNSACVSTTTGGDPASNDCGSTSTPPGGNPDLRLSKSVASGDASPGSVLVYQLAVTNAGTRDAAGVTLHETVPQLTTFQGGGLLAGVVLHAGRQCRQRMHLDRWDLGGRGLGDLLVRGTGGEFLSAQSASDRQLGVRQHDDRRRSREQRLRQHQHTPGRKS